jgi:hypothetical protein
VIATSFWKSFTANLPIDLKGHEDRSDHLFRISGGL